MPIQEHCLSLSKPLFSMAKRGRKKIPASEKKVTLIIYPRKKQVDAVGGESAAKQIALQSIVKRAG